ncbi:hypothetical protein GLOIN_2v1514804 [Rhizophagus irregularis DAOM 181602=DAOM 197198]|nr:hypothetical protein GLOIN_2v1514804 [Rhizophagus irregularis DAOM 181602=DAOM 197198]
MPYQPLPIECISHIFESFQDNKNLYTCLLVNRFWCRIAIPILYKTPFTRNQERNKSQQSKIISTYLSCLNLKLRLNDDVMDSLANFLSLKVLGFESCYIITTSDNQDRYNDNFITNNSNFQLEKLYLVENMSRHMISDIKCLIIRYFSISLQELILDELNSDIVKIISNFCSNIKRLILLATEYEIIYFDNYDHFPSKFN